MLISLLLLQSPTLEIGGRFMEDFGLYTGGERTEAALGLPFDDGAEVRAARIRVFGDLAEDIGYKMEYDWSGGAASLEDAYLQFRPDRTSSILVGHQDEPFGLDHLTSTRFVTFLERSSPIRTFAPDHNMGITYWGHRDAWTLGGGVFRETDSS
ncbi:MAG: porin, partial [Planctomycetota bacterium]